MNTKKCKKEVKKVAVLIEASVSCIILFARGEIAYIKLNI